MKRWSLIPVMVLLLAACAPVAPTTREPEGTPVQPSMPAQPPVQSWESPTTPAEKGTPMPQPPARTPMGSEMPLPYAPQESDAHLMRESVYLESVDLVTQESYPRQYMLALRGALPTPCHELRVRATEPEALKIQVEVYSVVDGSKICIQVLQPFEAMYPLRPLELGTYTVWVNGKEVGKIQLP